MTKRLNHMQWFASFWSKLFGLTSTFQYLTKTVSLFDIVNEYKFSLVEGFSFKIVFLHYSGYDITCFL